MDDETAHDDWFEDDDDSGAVHMGYYVRRVEDDLVLVQVYQVDSDDSDEPVIHTAYIALDDLEPEWQDEVLAQGSDLEDGKSVEFYPPDDDADDEDPDDDEDFFEIESDE